MNANLNDGTPEKSFILNVTHTLENSDTNTVTTTLSNVTPEMNYALDVTHTPDNNDKNIASTSRLCAVTSEKSSALDITHTPDNSDRKIVSTKPFDVTTEISNTDVDVTRTGITHTPDNSNRKIVSPRRQISFIDDSQFCMFSYENSQQIVETVNTCNVIHQESNLTRMMTLKDVLINLYQCIPTIFAALDMYHQPLQKMLVTHICVI